MVFSTTGGARDAYSARSAEAKRFDPIHPDRPFDVGTAEAKSMGNHGPPRTQADRHLYVSALTTIDCMGTTSVRLPDDLLRRLDSMAKREHSDRSVVIRRAIERGVKSLSIDAAVEEYQRGGITAWSAAGQAGVTLWEFLDELKRRDLWFRTDEESLLDELEAHG